LYRKLVPLEGHPNHLPHHPHAFEEKEELGACIKYYEFCIMGVFCIIHNTRFMISNFKGGG
ncbi:MAG: hypothetical protein R6V40_01850, partial [Candidatus Moraniibacteriota bacterium]